MNIVVGSTNEAKVLAVKEVLANSPEFSGAHITSISTSSDVSDQPLSLQETIQGAKNRARNAFNKCNANIGFGIESGLMEAPDVSTGFLHISVCCIYDGKNYYTGLSTGFELPPQILESVVELSFSRFLGLFEPILNCNSGGYINFRILPPELQFKIGQKFSKKRRNLNSTTDS